MALPTMAHCSHAAFVQGKKCYKYFHPRSPKNSKEGLNKDFNILLNIQLQKVYVNRFDMGVSMEMKTKAHPSASLQTGEPHPNVSTQRCLLLCSSAGILHPGDQSPVGWTQKAPSEESWLCSLLL